MGRKKKQPTQTVIEPDGEWMIRWKRTRNNQWYYLPMVFNYRSEAEQRATKAEANVATIQVVKIEVVAVVGKESDEADV
jgi:hypothetical protein